MNNNFQQIIGRFIFLKKALIRYLYLRKRDYKRKSSYLAQQYYSSNKPKLNCNKRTIIYMADGKVQLGGLADRLRGITSVFEYCLRNNIEFKIFFNHPFELTDYLVPNEYNWTIDRSNISYNSGQAIPINFITTKEPVLLSPFNIEERYQKFILNKLCKTKSNQIHIYTNSYASGIRFGYLFNRLFKPSEAILKSLKEIKKDLGENYMSISTRFLELLGDFTEPNPMRTPLDEKAQTRLIGWCLEQIDLILKNYCNHGEKIFVTSDSQKFLSIVKTKPGIVILDGKIEHSDSHYCSRESNKKLFLDFLTIANAEKVFLLVGPNMYKSNFCKRAAMINNREYIEINASVSAKNN